MDEVTIGSSLQGVVNENQRFPRGGFSPHRPATQSEGLLNGGLWRGDSARPQFLPPGRACRALENVETLGLFPALAQP